MIEINESASRHLLQVLGQVKRRLEFIDNDCAGRTSSHDVRIVLSQFKGRAGPFADAHTNAVISRARTDDVMARRRALSRQPVVVAGCVIHLHNACIME